MTEAEQRAQYTGWSVEAGSVGYLREAYHGAPYATHYLFPEAFDADDCEAVLPAALMRKRLTHPCLPTTNGGFFADGGMAALYRLLQTAPDTELMEPSLLGAPATEFPDARSVEDAIRLRYADDQATVAAVLKSFRDFVALAERKEAELGQPCTVYVSY